VDRRVSGGRDRSSRDIIVRRAEASDLDALLAIENAAFTTDRLERRNFRHAVRSPTMICLVACKAENVLGYGIVERRRNAAAARLTSVAIEPHGTGQGLGTRLLEALEEETAAAGPRRMRLEVRADNAGARKLYERTGYRLVETLEDYHEDGGAALRYEKALAPG
jgi:[ribosomal protein S18]-alanine N-acetyltransferase